MKPVCGIRQLRKRHPTPYTAAVIEPIRKQRTEAVNCKILKDINIDGKATIKLKHNRQIPD